MGRWGERTRRFSAVLRTVALAAVMVAALLRAGPAAADPARIAVVAPITGAYQLLGRAIGDGVRLAAARLGKDDLPGGKPVVLPPYDDGCDPARIPAILDTLKKTKPTLVVGSLCYGATKALAGGLASAGVDAVVITPSVQEPMLTDQSPNRLLFRLAPRQDVMPQLLADEAGRLAKGGTVELIDDGSVYGRGLTASVKALLKAAGVAVTETAYTPGTTDFAVVAAHIGLDAPAVVVVGGYVEDIGRLAQAMLAAKLSIPILAGDSLLSGEAPQSLGPAEPLVRFAAQADPREAKGAADLVAALTMNDLPPDPLALSAAEAVALYAAAARKAKSLDAGKVAASLRSGPFDSPYGPISFDAKGDAHGGEGLIGYRMRLYRGDRLVDAQ